MNRGVEKAKKAVSKARAKIKAPKKASPLKKGKAAEKAEVSEVVLYRNKSLGEPRIPSLEMRAPEKSSVVVITVSPRRLFARYELPEKALERGRPVIRMHDITKIKAAPVKPESTTFRRFDIPIKKGAGSLYIPVMPGRDFIAELGVIRANGKFVRAGLSKRTSTPRTSPPKGKASIPDEYFEFRFGGSSR